MLSRIVKIFLIFLLPVFALFFLRGNISTAASYICGGQIQCLEETSQGSFVKYYRSCAYQGSTCTASCDPGDEKVSTTCSLTCQVGSAWQCPNAPFNCGANQEKWCDDCGGTSCRNVGGGGNGDDDPPPPDPGPDPAVCGSECSPGGVGSDGCGSGLVCAPDMHCTAGDAYKGDCGNPGDACGPVESDGYCYRACWGDVCGGGGGGDTCKATSPGAPSLLTPNSGADTGLVDVKLKWKSLAKWGEGCPSNDNQFKVFLTERVSSVCPNSGYTRLATLPRNIISYTTSTLEPSRQYCWYILADNGSKVTSSAVRWFSTDKAPTASITAPVDNAGFEQGAQISFSGTANDIDSPLDKLKFFRIDHNLSATAHRNATNWTQIGTTQNCAGNIGNDFSCIINRNWTPASGDIGCWDVRIDAIDSVGGTCSGYPSINNSWVDCGDTDYIKVCVNARVQGWIWEIPPGQSCSYTNKSTKEIKPSDVVPDSISPYIVSSPDNIYGNWDPDTYTDYSYKIDNVPGGDQTICAQPVSATPGYRYILTCINNDTAPGGSCAPINVDESSEKADLGYKLVTTGWFTSINGDVFGGAGSGFSVVDGIPASSGPDFASYLVQGIGSVFGVSDLSVKKQPANLNAYSQDSNRYVKNTGSPAFWPSNYNLTPPADATSFSNCNILTNGNLNPDITYKTILSDCLLGRLNGSDLAYKLSKDGVVVIYVTGSGSLTFKNNFRSNAGASSKRRIIFVTALPVVYGKVLAGYANPTLTSRPHVEATILTTGDITFKSNDPTADTTIVVEGPLVSKANVSLERDRKTTNNYPAEVIKFNPIYIDKLTTLELTNGTNKSGLFLNDAIWEEDQ